MKYFIILSWVLISLPAFAEGANVGKVVGTMGLVDGDVLLDSKPVKKNAAVREGAVVEVKKGHATLIIGKGSVFNIGNDSKMVVNQYGVKESGEENAELDLKFGRTRALILNQGNDKKDIRIKARAATMGVRGTEIYIDAPKESAKPIQFFTLEGKAEVKAHDGAPPIPVNQNQGVSTSGIAPPPQASNSSSDKGSEKKDGSDKKDGGDKKSGDNKSADNGKGKAGTDSNKGSDGKTADAKSGDAKSGEGSSTAAKGSGTAGANGTASTNSPNSGTASGGANPPPAAGGPMPGPMAMGPAPDMAPASMSMADVRNDIKNSGLDPAPATGGMPPPPPPPKPGVPGSLSGTLGLGALPPVMLDPVLDRNSTLSIQPHFCNATTGVCI